MNSSLALLLLPLLPLSRSYRFSNKPARQEGIRRRPVCAALKRSVEEFPDRTISKRMAQIDFNAIVCFQDNRLRTLLHLVFDTGALRPSMLTAFALLNHRTTKKIMLVAARKIFSADCWVRAIVGGIK